MEDLLNIDKLQVIIETYKEIRERFRQGDTYSPHDENTYFTDAYLDIGDANRGDIAECADMFLGYIHALFSIQQDASHGDWDDSVSNLANYLAPSEDDEEWLVLGKDMIRTWIEHLNVKTEIPY